VACPDGGFGEVKRRSNYGRRIETKQRSYRAVNDGAEEAAAIQAKRKKKFRVMR